MTYNEALKRERLRVGLSQREVAEILNVAQPLIAKWEIGEGSAPNISRLIQLADVYGTSIDQLVGRT